MRARLLSSLALTAIVISPTLQAAEGSYVAARGSIVMTDDADWIFNDGFGPVPANGDVVSKFKDGYGAGVALGMKLPSQFRVEGELLWQKNDIDSGRLGSLQLSALGGLNGDVSLWGGMLNGYYDFLEGPLVPFVGIGVGYAQVDANVKLGNISVINDNDSVLTYQAILGVSYEFMPNLSAVLAYRYMSMEDPKFKDKAGGKVDMGYDSQAVDLGLRYSF
ncbi:MAG: outer membrane beta-barrel protein [Pseudomonadota bacterium]